MPCQKASTKPSTAVLAPGAIEFFWQIRRRADLCPKPERALGFSHFVAASVNVMKQQPGASKRLELIAQNTTTNAGS